MNYTKAERHSIYKKLLKKYTFKYADSPLIFKGLCDTFEDYGYSILDFIEIINLAEQNQGNCGEWWWHFAINDPYYNAWKKRREVLKKAIEATK